LRSASHLGRATENQLMNIHLVTPGPHAFIEGAPDTPLLQTPEDVVGLLEVCFAERTRSVLLYATNLPPRFFDLSSGDAGAILQKLRNYRTRLAVVVAPDAPLSAHFQALMREEQHGPDFRLFATRDAAAAWLQEG
jgi:hypothetical protein